MKSLHTLKESNGTDKTESSDFKLPAGYKVDLAEEFDLPKMDETDKKQLEESIAVCDDHLESLKIGLKELLDELENHDGNVAITKSEIKEEIAVQKADINAVNAYKQKAEAALKKLK